MNGVFDFSEAEQQQFAKVGLTIQAITSIGWARALPFTHPSNEI